MTQGILITLLVIAILVLTWTVNSLMKRFETFDYDEHNPYRRYCKTCNQCQVENCYPDAWTKGWWEEQGEIKDPDCKCHKYSEYRR